MPEAFTNTTQIKSARHMREAHNPHGHTARAPSTSVRDHHSLTRISHTSRQCALRCGMCMWRVSVGIYATVKLKDTYCVLTVDCLSSELSLSLDSSTSLTSAVTSLELSSRGSPVTLGACWGRWAAHGKRATRVSACSVHYFA